MGGTEATAVNSTAMGYVTRQHRVKHRPTMGDSTEASGKYSTAMGLSTIASGQSSTAMGDSTEASRYNTRPRWVQGTRTGYAEKLYDAFEVVSLKGSEIYNLISQKPIVPHAEDDLPIICARI